MKIRFIEPILEEGSYVWLLDHGGLLAGVHAREGWCLRLKDGRVLPLDVPGRFVALLPLLELREEDLSAFLERAAASAPAWAAHVLAFPREAFLKHAFQSAVGGYWPERAFSWLATDEALWPRLRDELEAFLTKTEMPQRARQQAKRMLRAMRRGQ